MNNLRILFFLQFPNPFPAAAWTRISFFAEYFKRMEQTVAISGIFSPKSISKFGLRKWNSLSLFNITPMIMTSNIFSLIFNILSSFFSSIMLIIFFRPDTVVISVPNGDGALGCYLASKILRKKITIDYRDEWEDFAIGNTTSGFHKRLYIYLKSIMTKCYINCDLVITVTEPLANRLFERGVRNVKVLTNGADPKVFKPYDKMESRYKIGFDESDFIIIYSGGIGGYYKLDIVVKAIRKLIPRIKNIKLLMVGEGLDVENVLSLAREVGVSDQIFYLGSKFDKSELAEMLSAADVGIIPYDDNPLWKNALPAKSFEYFACGIPVIASVYKDSILGKLILENGIGLVSEPGNVDALADCLESIYHDASFRKGASERAVSLIEEHFDRNKIAEKLLNLIVIINGKK